MASREGIWRDSSGDASGSRGNPSSSHRDVHYHRRAHNRFQPTATAQAEAKVDTLKGQGWPDNADTRRHIPAHESPHLQTQYHQEQAQIQAPTEASIPHPHTAPKSLSQATRIDPNNYWSRYVVSDTSSKANPPQLSDRRPGPPPETVSTRDKGKARADSGPSQDIRKDITSTAPEMESEALPESMASNSKREAATERKDITTTELRRQYRKAVAEKRGITATELSRQYREAAAAKRGITTAELKRQERAAT